MTNLQSIHQKFDKCCFTLSKEDILKLDKTDNGPINNVVAGINKHCYGARLFDDQYGLTVEMFYVNNDQTLKGDIIRLDINDEDYFHLLFRFCVLLSNEYVEVDAIDAFNTFQTKLRSFLEKSGFYTTTSQVLKQFEGKSAVMIAFSQRGIFNVKIIDKVDFFRDFFNRNYDTKTESSCEYVYLMVNTDTSLIKIGTSKNPKYRERTLHSQEPKVHLIAKWNCSKKLEKKLHQTYKHKRIRGEWFRLDLNDLKEIETFMNSETNSSR
ncbi:GIY-YIG nuclease family protein [Chitinophaga ginsengisegetis]|uniref:GIY-YIG nuclease family protein n=1 Tax=Chitinophaga ginsengisegetis TaxID=393003 RepID=UPI000DBF58A9|nr:GIY-YIG nuclease family protein [Chitinophaga ginsengisegetis]MDR6571366.1 hypothetical protein [Chitinophaga ginsengisegetis]MDR6651100.1 hypothetical protein [Chitinophaga ginsengisegetis]MDR6657447.1 hypothetical protein [Chitinophaga ginsengisegetis]